MQGVRTKVLLHGLFRSVKVPEGTASLTIRDEFSQKSLSLDVIQWFSAAFSAIAQPAIPL